MRWLKNAVAALLTAAILMGLRWLGVPYGEMALMGVAILVVWVDRLQQRIDLLERKHRE